MKKILLFALPFLFGFNTSEPCDVLFKRLKKVHAPVFVEVKPKDLEPCSILNFETVQTFTNGLTVTNHIKVSDSQFYLVLNGVRNDTFFKCILTDNNAIKTFYAFPCERKTEDGKFGKLVFGSLEARPSIKSMIYYRFKEVDTRNNDEKGQYDARRNYRDRIADTIKIF